jgi:hypothetical protein
MAAAEKATRCGRPEGARGRPRPMGSDQAVLSTLTRRCPDDHVAIVADYAERSTGVVDSNDDLAHPSDGQSWSAGAA